MLEKLAERGYTSEQLEELRKLVHGKDSDLYDVLKHVAYNKEMVPRSDRAAFAKTHPEVDLGLHLTLTSEWTNYRWGPMGRDSVSSLLDADQYFHGLCHEMAETATVAEVELELSRQVEQALRMGIRPSAPVSSSFTKAPKRATPLMRPVISLPTRSDRNAAR